MDRVTDDHNNFDVRVEVVDVAGADDPWLSAALVARCKLPVVVVVEIARACVTFMDQRMGVPLLYGITMWHCMA